MFVLKEDHSYEWPVDVKVPIDGKYKHHKFFATFRVLPNERIEEMSDNEVADKKVIEEVLAGWREVKDEDGGDIEFSSETRDALLAIPYVLVALGRAYYESIVGEKYRTKN